MHVVNSHVGNQHVSRMTTTCQHNTCWLKPHSSVKTNETTQDAQTRLRSEPPSTPGGGMHTRRPSRKGRSRSRARHPHQRHRRSRSRHRDKRSRSHRARRTHRHRPRTHRSQAFTSEADPNWGSYQCPTPVAQRRERVNGATGHRPHTTVPYMRDTASPHNLTWRRGSAADPVGGPQQCHQPATTAGDGQASSNATPGRTANTCIIQRRRRCPAFP